MALARSEIDAKNHWNTTALFRDWDHWQSEWDSLCQSKNDACTWPHLADARAEMTKCPQNLSAVLDLYFTTQLAVEKLYTYAHLRHDEDIAHSQHKQAYQRALALYHTFARETAWLQPDLLALPADKLQQLKTDVALDKYALFLDRLLRVKPHALSAEQEELLALTGQPLGAIQRAFSALNNADLQWGAVVDAEGNSHSLTLGSYQKLIRHPDRLLRQNSFQQLHQSYAEHANTLCELLQGQVQNHIFHAQAYRHSSCLDRALFAHNIDPQVYLNLIATVRAEINLLHDYLALRKQVLKLDELHLYDLYVPLLPEHDNKIPYETAVEKVIASVAVLGAPYQQQLRAGLTQRGWVDRCENKFKRSGAYSSGCHGSYPYILLNYGDQLNDAFTLAHEAGHSMHSALSWANQPYHQSGYSIFVAEVASTFNEELLLHLLLQETQDKKMRAYLINHKLEEIRGTLFRQTMFAEFELWLHQSVEAGNPLTPELLKQQYLKLNREYFGPAVVVDGEIAVEWARIPHFYYNFYVYQYATGISAALALSQAVLEQRPEAAARYLNFLKQGGSVYPLDALKQVGVDLTTPQPVEAALAQFKALTKELRELLS